MDVDTVNGWNLFTIEVDLTAETPVAKLLIQQIVPEGSELVVELHGDEMAVHVEPGHELTKTER